MPLEEQVPTVASQTEPAVEAPVTASAVDTAKSERMEKLLKAKELYSIGSRNFLIKSYTEAADELSHVCALYAEVHGELADELGMPYLLYAKSLIALSLDENKVIDVPDEEPINDDDEDNDDVDDEDNEEDEHNANDESEAIASKGNCERAKADTNGTHVTKLKTIKEQTKNDEADSTADEIANEQSTTATKQKEKTAEEAQVSSTDDAKAKTEEAENSKKDDAASSTAAAVIVFDDEKPSTSNGDAAGEQTTEEDEDNEAASNLQLAWEILEMAAKIFTRQGESGLPNLAEVQTELGNIQFENSILDAARCDYERALEIYSQLSAQSYRRAMAEIHYKIGLSFLMQQLNKEGATSLKRACELIQAEIEDIKAKPKLEDKDSDNIQDMEETKQEIEAKISEIEEMQAQQIADVRAALDSYIKPMLSHSHDGAGPSSSSAFSSASASTSSATASASTSKPNDISHLIKRKKPDEPSSEAEAAASPAKRPTP